MKTTNLCKLMGMVLVLALFSPLYGQGWNFKEITRAKLWARIWNTAGAGQPTLSGQDYFKFDYPGHELAANIEDHTGWVEWAGYMAWADVDGIGTPFRLNMAYDPVPTFISPIEDAKLIKNHNMEDPSLKAEEILTGVHIIVEFGVECHFRVLAWSYPRYDDFLIYEYVFKNTGGRNITNFRFAPTAEIDMPHPVSDRFEDDDYEWDIEHEAFYFHDGVQWDANFQPVVRQFGLTQSDRGEPADLEAPDAINHEFLGAQYFTYYWLDKPEKSDPSERDHLNIVDKDNLNQHSNRIQEDPLNDNPEPEFDSDTYIVTALQFDQPLPPTAEDGTPLDAEAARLGLSIAAPTRFERFMDYIYETGPYDLPAGGELKFVLCVAAGMMDMERVAAGGKENEAHLIDGADSLWAHVDAAIELFNRGYEAPDPPPTPTNGNNSLVLTPIPGGVKIQWPPIPDSYVDPDFGVNDFAGYRVYRATHRPIGPFMLIADIPKDQAVIEDGMVTYRDEGRSLGVGVFFGVTSYDTGHNTPWPFDPTVTSVPPLESGLVNANIDPVYPQSTPSNNLDDVLVYPNPFNQHSRLVGEGERFRIEFVNIPAQCTIRIYTLAGERVQTIEHDDLSGDESWGSRATLDYQVNRFLQRVAPGTYLFHVESHVPGHEGESKIGKFVIIK